VYHPLDKDVNIYIRMCYKYPVSPFIGASEGAITVQNESKKQINFE
jgi:hypothetical protein